MFAVLFGIFCICNNEYTAFVSILSQVHHRFHSRHFICSIVDHLIEKQTHLDIRFVLCVLLWSSLYDLIIILLSFIYGFESTNNLSALKLRCKVISFTGSGIKPIMLSAVFAC